MAQLQKEYENLQQTATEQINAALQEGAGAAQAALDEARRGGDSALQEALERESDLAADVERLSLEKEVKSRVFEFKCAYAHAHAYAMLVVA